MGHRLRSGPTELAVGATVQTLLFSDDGTLIQTNGGQLHTAFLSDGAAVSRTNLLGSVFVKERWISSDMVNLLWLPSD
jgi:hypothetical protein